MCWLRQAPGAGADLPAVPLHNQRLVECDTWPCVSHRLLVCAATGAGTGTVVETEPWHTHCRQCQAAITVNKPVYPLRTDGKGTGQHYQWVVLCDDCLMDKAAQIRGERPDTAPRPRKLETALGRVIREAREG